MARALSKRRLQALELVLHPRLPNHNRFEEWTDEQLMAVLTEGPHKRVLDLLDHHDAKR